MRWTETDKGDPRCRRLADRHYTRQSPGHPMWTRPGYNFVLYFEDAVGAAAFCWWRPKWEDGVERFDKLRAIECTIFRNESGVRSSELIVEACAAVQTWERATSFPWPDGLITAVGSKATQRRRSKRSLPGHCFRMAGFEPFEHAVGRGDIWLRCTILPPAGCAPMEVRGQMLIAL